MASTTLRRFGRRVSASLLIGWALFFTSVSAQNVTEPYSMTIYSSIEGASEVLAGEYAKAINLMLQARGIGETKILLSNNLCAAYVLSRQLELAGVTCDKALYEASLSRNYGDWFQRQTSFRAKREYRSRALANRSVLRHLLGDSMGAAKDLEQAIDLYPYIVDRNKK